MKNLRLYSLCFLISVAAFAGSGCNGDTPTSPTTTDTATTTATIASPSITEEFIGSVPVSGSAFYSFTVTTYGTVNVTLTDVSGAFVPSTVTLGLALGTPSGETCAQTSTISTTKGSSPQLSATYQPGVYCAMVSDVGNLYAAARFAVTIAYP